MGSQRVRHNLATEQQPSPMVNTLACLHSPWVTPSSLRICLSTSQVWVLAAKLVPHDPCSLILVSCCLYLEWMAIYVGCNATRIYWKPHFSQILKADLDDLDFPHKPVLIRYVNVLLLCSKCLANSPQDTLYLLQKLTLKGHKVSKEKLQFL